MFTPFKQKYVEELAKGYSLQVLGVATTVVGTIRRLLISTLLERFPSSESAPRLRLDRGNFST